VIFFPSVRWDYFSNPFGKTIIWREELHNLGNLTALAAGEARWITIPETVDAFRPTRPHSETETT
jgi:hypothetical protein